MQPIKLLHTADLHIGMENYGGIDPNTGMHSRVMDFLRRLTDMVDYAIDQEVDIFVFAGDAYKMREPNATFQREFARRIKRVADAGIPVILLVGNHDLHTAQRRAPAISIFATLDVPNVYVGAGYELLTVKCRRGQVLQVATAPFPLREDHALREEWEKKSIGVQDALISERITARILDLAEQASRTAEIPTILVGHFSVDQASLGSERNIMVGRDIAVDRSLALAHPIWRYVALGHIHKHQSLNRDQQPPIVYSGSPERIDFGEEKDPKGWVVATIADGPTTWEFVEQYRRPARRFLTIDIDVREAEDPTAAVVERIAAAGDLSGAVVRVRLVFDEVQQPRLVDRDIAAALKPAFHAKVERDVRRHLRDPLGGVSVEALTPTQMLERYFESRSVEPARSKMLLQYAEELIREVESHD